MLIISHNGRWVAVLAAQLFPILWDPIDCRLLCSWYSPGENTGVGCTPFSRASSQPRDQTQVSCIADGSFTVWASRETKSTYQNQRPAMADLHVLLLTNWHFLFCPFHLPAAFSLLAWEGPSPYQHLYVFCLHFYELYSWLCLVAQSYLTLCDPM